MKNTLHINLWAGPGVGKSGLAGYIFGTLKENHIDCELVREYAKELQWSNTLADTEQLIISAEQYKRESATEGKNDVVIVDTALLAGVLHCSPDYAPQLLHILTNLSKDWNSKHYFIERNLNSPYEHNGRRHTLSQSLEFDKNIYKFFKENDIDYKVVKIENALQEIVKDIKEYIRK